VPAFAIPGGEIRHAIGQSLSRRTELSIIYVEHVRFHMQHDFADDATDNSGLTAVKLSLVGGFLGTLSGLKRRGLTGAFLGGLAGGTVGYVAGAALAEGEAVEEWSDPLSDDHLEGTGVGVVTDEEDSEDDGDNEHGEDEAGDDEHDEDEAGDDEHGEDDGDDEHGEDDEGDGSDEE
jgi:hypothetical protein